MDPHNPTNKLLSAEDVVRFFRRVGVDYRPKDLRLFQQALTDSSYRRPEGASGGAPPPPGCVPLQDCDYESLETRGDAIIDCAIMDYLCTRFPEGDPHFLTKMRSRLVSNERLAEIARAWGLQAWILLGQEEESKHLRAAKKVLANVVEAWVAAYRVDAGLPAALALVVAIFESSWIDWVGLITLQDNQKDRFQHYCQLRWHDIPTYIDQPAAAGAGAARCAVEVRSPDGSVRAIGHGYTRKEAQEAACAAANEILDRRAREATTTLRATRRRRHAGGARYSDTSSSTE